MITTWIIIKDNIILGSVETDNKQAVIKSLSALGISEYDEIRDTKQNNSVRPKLNINEYNPDYTLKSDIERIAGGWLEAPKGKKLNADKTELIDKTTKEKIDDGEIELSEYQKYDEETKEIRGKKLSELYADKLLTLEDYINNYVRPQRNYQLDRVDIVYCNALNLSKMSSEKIAEWDVYKQKLKDLPDNVTEVKDDVTELFPVMPE